jgi:hypothetical protein
MVRSPSPVEMQSGGSGPRFEPLAPRWVKGLIIGLIATVAILAIVLVIAAGADELGFRSGSAESSPAGVVPSPSAPIPRGHPACRDQS